MKLSDYEKATPIVQELKSLNKLKESLNTKSGEFEICSIIIDRHDTDGNSYRVFNTDDLLRSFNPGYMTNKIIDSVRSCVEDRIKDLTIFLGEV